jgi:N-acetylglucosaminyldiphosphoundecaprenol N-acetyl-beta-D-mannosaminyltransferase
MRVTFLGAPLDLMTVEEVRDRAVRAVGGRECVIHCSLNALKVVEASGDSGIQELLTQFDLVTADGMSVVWGLALKGELSTARVAGVDLMDLLLREGARRRWRFYLLGSRPEVSLGLRERVESLYPGVRVVGARDGYFERHQEIELVQAISESEADVLFVGMPSPQKERFLAKHRQALGVPFSMCVGGGLDLLAGRTTRAPMWMRQSGMEWAYRVLQEPRRLAKRYLVTNLRFARLLSRELAKNSWKDDDAREDAPAEAYLPAKSHPSGVNAGAVFPLGE